ncbi:MAG: hypothetical protein HZB38_18980, partial [Planctomycetes bacterium]|nr:hypothetical protein [Planctomycetota bacterium]
MKTEHKIAAAAVGFIGLIVTIFYIANQPKNDKSTLPLDKNIAAGNSAKTVGDKGVAAAPTGGAKPNAPAIPAAKPNTPATKVDSPLTNAAPTKTEPTLPPVATPAPARRGPETTADAAGPTGEPTTTPPASPGPTSPSPTLTPGLPSGATTLEPKPATTPPAGSGTTPTGRELSGMTSTPG